MLVNLIILVILGNLKILVILVNMLILAKLVILQKLFFSAKTGDSVESCDSNASFKTDDTDDSWGPSFLNKVPQTIRARVETPPGNAQIPVREFERASLLPIYQFRFSFLLTMTSAQCH